MYVNRHIDTNSHSTTTRLQALNLSSWDDLIKQAVPDAIRQSPDKLSDRLSNAISEQDLIKVLRNHASSNQVWRSFIGNGYYGCHTPAVIQRTVFENPAWYTAYTPYQPEISQGRLELLFYFQTMICELTGLPLSNASLLDEATAVVEAMLILFRTSKKPNTPIFSIVSDSFPQTCDVLVGRATALGITLEHVDHPDEMAQDSFGCLIQSPNRWGTLVNIDLWRSKRPDVPIIMATDLLALTLMKSPKDWGVAIAVGSTQRFGVPMGYGGPHAAFIATAIDYKRELPGRIVGLSKTRQNEPAYRLALQTREQHIRRDKATSNICTAQALLAVMATLYAIYHGPVGLTSLASDTHAKATELKHRLNQVPDLVIKPGHFFDTITLETTPLQFNAIKQIMVANQINLYYDTNTHYISIACDSVMQPSDVDEIITLIAQALSVSELPLTNHNNKAGNHIGYHLGYHRDPSDVFLTQPVFNQYHTETQLMRYIRGLESRDLSLVHSMIPLGSCTMKLNAASTLMAVSWPAFSQLHPFCPINQAAGYHQIIQNLAADLATLTGMAGVALQPNSGAQGELTGLLVMKAYFNHNQASQRQVILIPESAHGTNPASARLAGLRIVTIPSDADNAGAINNTYLAEKAAELGDTLFGMMITYPSTHGVFEDTIKTSCDIIHQHGGLVYMDGANLNAQLGITTPGFIGADVCHLNLHKTFAIPHGGGGPGVGPIAVTDSLLPFLPHHPITGIAPVTAAPWGSASILLISYAYNRLLGLSGLTQASQYAILNANYIAHRLKDHYKILYTNDNGYVAHELIVDCRPFKKTAGISVDDVAKRLIDYGFHAPTMSWPVTGTLMIEPTESESLTELDRFCDAMIAIRAEIQTIESGMADPIDNVLKQAPHTKSELMADNWMHAYTRSEAQATGHLAATVSRIDHAYGDRNLVCACS